MRYNQIQIRLDLDLDQIQIRLDLDLDQIRFRLDQIQIRLIQI